MSSAVQNCSNPQQPETVCERLAREIDELINRQRTNSGSGTKGLIYRFPEQIAAGAKGPGTPEWINHEQTISEQQEAIRKRLRQYDKNDCDNKGPPLPNRARNWAFRPVPSSQEWRKNNPLPMVDTAQDKGFIERVKAATGLTGLALALYLIVSEGSRLYPPRNLVPVL